LRTTSVARRYAKATFDVARERGDPQAWLGQLEGLSQVLSDQELLVAMRSPSLSYEQKLSVITTALPDLIPELRNLVALLIQRHRIGIVPAVAAAFASYLDEMLGRAEVEVVSARPLSKEEISQVEQLLTKRTGLVVKLKTVTNSALIGGIVIRVGDELIDASVATRLERLRQGLA